MKKLRICLLFVGSIFWLLACSENESIAPVNSVTNENMPQWNELIQTLDFESNIVIVEKDGSIQEAIDAASPGDVIYVEPGIYKEALKIDKQNISIVGISFDDNEKAILKNPGGNEKGIDVSVNHESVTIQNIDFLDFKSPGVTIYPLGKKQLKKDNCLLLMNREDLGGGIAHYEFDIKMGSGEFDMVRLHRVVKELRPYFPVHTNGDIFMVHGAIQDFEDIFLIAGAENINEETSAPFYLASKNIDVWGIDLGWNMVPMETSDFSFMEGWGVEKDIVHTLKALSIARLIRGLTRQGFRKMNLLGFSYGVDIAYGAAGKETQIRRVCRNMKGIIPVDSQLKLIDNDKIAVECASAQEHKNLLDSDEFVHPWGVGLIQLAGLALNAPDDPSTVPPFDTYGFTNLQVMMAIGSDRSAGWHFLGGNPGALNFSDPMRFVRLCVNLAPYQPRLMFYEMAATACPDIDVSFDDNLSKIKLPILYVSSEGGDNSEQDYTASLTQSTDISRIHIDDPEQETEVDFGHADLWMAYDASELVWEPLRQWLLTH